MTTRFGDPMPDQREVPVQIKREVPVDDVVDDDEDIFEVPVQRVETFARVERFGEGVKMPVYRGSVVDLGSDDEIPNTFEEVDEGVLSESDAIMAQQRESIEELFSSEEDKEKVKREEEKEEVKRGRGRPKKVV